MNVKPGDMAKVAGCTSLPACNGTIVSVEFDATLCLPWSAHGLLWACTIATGMRSFDGPDSTSKLVYALPGDTLVFPDAWLRRIGPEDDPDAIVTAGSREVTA
jgi:hypothetical protein